MVSRAVFAWLHPALRPFIRRRVCMARKAKSSKAKAEPRQVFVQGVPATLVGRELRVGMQAPPFQLVTFDEGIVSAFTKQDVLDIGKPCLLCCMTSVDT